LIALDGDKDDDLDAEKLAQLLRGGFVKAAWSDRSRRGQRTFNGLERSFTNRWELTQGFPISAALHATA
jgi:hypothetical protein